MKKLNTRGFSAVGIVMLLVVFGSIIATGWLVYSRQNKKVTTNPASSEHKADEAERESIDTEVKTINGIKYSVPSGWSDDSGDASGYILSPDYKEAGSGQLSIDSGASIYFTLLDWDGIGANTTIEQAIDLLKNSDGGYYDQDSVKTTTINGKEAIIFNSGHTTDSISLYYKTSDNIWLNADFNTSSNNDIGNDAANNQHYEVFLEWAEKFLQLNQ